MFWVFSSATRDHSSATGDHVQESASIGKLFCIASEYNPYPSRLRKVQTGRKHARSSVEKHQSRIRTLTLHRTRDKILQNIVKCDDDIRKGLHDSVMSFDDMDAFKGIIERMTKDQCAVWSRIFVSATVNITVSFGAKPKLRVSVESCTDLTPSHSCTFASLPCCMQSITLATHSRWLKSCHKIDLRLTICLSHTASLLTTVSGFLVCFCPH